MTLNVAKKQQNLDDMRFIYDKVGWYLNQNHEDLMVYFQEHKMDSLYNIPHPKLGKIICGREASEKFYNIAERYLSSQKEGKNKSNLDEFVKKLKEEFTRRFLQNGEEINESKVEKMISTAYKSMSREFTQLTHYIPCAIFFSRTIDSFNIGPINFLHKTKFESTYADEIEQLRIQIKEQHQEHCAEAIIKGFPSHNIATEEQSQQLAEELVEGLLSAFENWEWIAVVTIPECNEKISYTKAISSTKTALNILKLLLGSEFTDQIRTEKDYGESPKSAKLTRNENGKLEISLSSTVGGNVIGSDWLDVLNAKSGYYFDLTTKALQLSLEFNDTPPLCARFIDALSWYGDAVYEQSYAAKIVKFVTSIERITGTGIETGDDGKERGVTDIVTSRSSIFYSFATDESLTDSLEKVKKIYDCRSSLVHGSISPFDKSCISYAHKAGEISRMVLLVGLDYFFSLSDDLSLSEKQLKKKYKELEASKDYQKKV